MKDEEIIAKMSDAMNRALPFGQSPTWNAWPGTHKLAIEVLRSYPTMRLVTIEAKARYTPELTKQDYAALANAAKQVMLHHADNLDYIQAQRMKLRYEAFIALYEEAEPEKAEG